MTFIKIWITKICITSILIILCDIIIPKRYKSICNMFFGILMIIVIITPAIQLINNKDMLVSKISENNNFLNSNSIYINKKIENTQKYSMLEIYKDQMCRQIKSGIVDKLNISVDSVELEAIINQSQKIEVTKVTLIMYKDDNHGNKGNAQNNQLKIKSFVAALLNIDSSKIFIQSSIE